MTREDAIDVLKHNYPSACFTELCDAVEIAIQALSADAVQIVRCKDCKQSRKDDVFHTRWCQKPGSIRVVKDEFFCAYGERKNDE